MLHQSILLALVLLLPSGPAAAAACDPTRVLGVGPIHSALSAPRSFHVADVDRDGRPDLLYITTGDSSGVAIARGIGGGAFAAPVLLVAGPSPIAMTTFDYNRDGPVDLAVADASDSYVRLFRGHGDGGFDPPLLVYVNAPQTDIVTADFNKDFIDDLAIASEAAGSIAVVFGHGLANGVGDGTYGNPYTARMESPNSRPRFIVVDDTNHDGIPEVVAAATGDSEVQTFQYDPVESKVRGETPTLATGVGSAAGISGTPFSPTGARRFAVAGPESSAVAIVGLGLPTIRARTSAPPLSVLQDDLDQDGFEDVLVGSAQGLVFLRARTALGKAYGTYYEAESIPSPAVEELFAGDLEGHGTTELIAVSRSTNAWFEVKPRCLPPPPPQPFVFGTWPAGGRVICAAAGDQQAPVVAADSTGGAFIAWEDKRNGPDRDVFVSHVRGDATLATGWPVDGVPVFTGPLDQSNAQLVPDGSGGVHVFASEPDALTFTLRWQHLDANGAPMLPPGGALLLPGRSLQSFDAMTDGDGGFLVVYADTSADHSWRLVANRWARPGIPSGWPQEGFVLRSGASAEWLEPVLSVADGGGGADVVYQTGTVTCTKTICFHSSAQYASGIVDGNLYRGTNLLSELIARLKSDPAGGSVGVRSAGSVVGMRNDPTGPRWTASLPFAPAAFEDLCGDGVRGAYFAYAASGGTRLLRLGSNGTPPSAWPANGIDLELPAGALEGMENDALGGLHYAWFGSAGDTLSVAHRAFFIGGLTQSLRLTTSAVRAAGSQVTADGAGGALVTWVDTRGGTRDIYAMRVGPSLVSVPPPIAEPLALAGTIASPARAGSRIRFRLANGSPASLSLVDARGRTLWRLPVGELGPGPHEIAMPAETRLPSGVYFLRLVQAGESRSKKLVWLD